MILNIKSRNRGYYIRWYNDGWHTWFFRAIDETLTTQGELHKTNVVYSFTMGDDALNKAELYAISGLLKAIYIQIYTSDGWKACTIDSGTFSFGQNYRNGANVQFNIKVWAKTGMFSPVVPVRIIPALLMVGTFTQFIATSTTDSDSQTFTVTAQNCLTDVIVTAPTNYLISLDEVTWASSLTLELQGVNVPTTTIYIKLEANPSGDYDGNITATTTGASDTLAVDGIVAAEVKLGYLYNWYAVSNVKNIANTGWKVPTSAEYDTMITALGGASVAGGKLKETGTTYWTTPNTGATNSEGFNGRGAGLRGTNGTYVEKNEQSTFFTSTEDTPEQIDMRKLLYNSAEVVSGSIASYITGAPLRIMKESTTLSDGEAGTYIGNDGRVYNTICIGTQEWLASNLAETKFRDLTSITKVTDGATWAALTSEGYCAYDNNEDNV